MAYDQQLDIKFGSEKHAQILRAINARVKLAQDGMVNRRKSWDHADEIYRCYVKYDAEDRVRKSRRENSGKPEFVTVYVPYSYAILLTALTYWSSVFLSRNPVLQFTGRHGQTEMQTQAVEALMDYQINVGGMLPSLYNWLLDPGKYGIGVLGSYWCEETEVVSRMTDKQETFMGIPIPGKTKKVKETVNIAGYKGNKVFNVRPHDWLPDPRMPISRFQDGEFCGRVVHVGWNTILRGKAEGRYFNVDELKKIKSGGRFEEAPAGADIDMPQTDNVLETQTFDKGTESVELVEMVVELVPKDWQLGNGNMPEKWVFTRADNQVIIGAQPLGCFHNKFPYDLNQYEIDAYSISPRGMLELADPLNETMNWLFNTHFYNVRKILNGVVVADPSRINMNDLKDGGPGGVWRLKPTAYGSDVRTVVAQQELRDVTTNHLRDTNVVADLIQRVLGTSDAVMGMLAPGGRKTATEVRTSSSFGVNRLKTNSEYFSAVGWTPFAMKLLQNTQQRYDGEQMFKIAGDLINGPRFINVTPELIAGSYDFVPVDGTMPVDRFAQANLWKEILAMSAKVPQIAQSYDLGGIFEWAALLGGLKNIKQFKIKTQVIPDAAAGGPGMAPLPKGGPMGDPTRLIGAGNVGSAGPTG